jgi:hypothetical protein
MVLANIEEMVQSLPGIITVTCIFGGWIAVSVISSIAKNWRKVQESEHAAALKQSMIERGMSVDEIERVLRAAPATSDSEEALDESTRISKKLAEHGVPGPAVEHIVGAYHAANPGTKKTLSATVVAMLDGGADSEQVLAAVRAIARPSATAPQESRFRDDPAYHN